VALLRSDPGHLQNTMLMMPFILVLGAQDLPGWLATSSLSRRTIRWMFVVVALAMLPAGKLRMWRQILVTPFTRFTSDIAMPDPIVPDRRIAYARATPLLTDVPSISPTVSMRQVLDFATEVHTLVRGRHTYVTDYGDVFTGPLYFFADLTPAPYPLDLETMTINDAMRVKVVEHIRAHPADYGAYIGGSLEAPEARAFLSTHPDAEHVERTLGSKTVHILVVPLHAQTSR
jgi:hypothetical protein